MAGEGLRIVGVEADPYNAEQVARRAATLLEELAQALDTIVGALAGRETGELTRAVWVPWGQVTVESRVLRLNAEHARDLRGWRGAGHIAAGVGPRCMLEAALHESPRALERLAQEMPARERDTSLVCGVWTTKDVVGHVADWEAYVAEGVARAPQSGNLAEEISPSGIDAWNAERAALRRDRSREAVSAAYRAATRATDEALAGLDEAGPARLYPDREVPTLYAELPLLPGTAWSTPGRSSVGSPEA